MPGVRVEGPTTPTVWWGCVPVEELFCSDTDQVSALVYGCRSIATTGIPQFPYIHRFITDCERECGFIEQIAECSAVSGPTTGFEPPDDPPPTLTPTSTINDPSVDTTFTRLPPDQIRRPDVFDVPDNIETGVVDRDLREFTSLLVGDPPGDQSFSEFPRNNSIDVNNLFENNFLENTVSSSGSVYHKIYNIFNYEESLSNNYTDNDLNLDIFDTYIPEEVAYMLKNKNLSIEWSERYALGISKAKLVKSLKPRVYTLFKSILDIDGKLVDSDYFLGAVKRHLVNGTIDDFDINYFYRLAEKQRGTDPLSVTLSESSDLNRRAALGLLAAYANSADPQKYDQLQQRIEASRKRFLLTDIEASVILETETEEVFPLFLEDAGMSMLGPSALEEHVPTGPGDGYYFVIETIDGQEVPLELDTAVSAAYFPTPDIRKIVLEMMGEDAAAYLTAGSTFAKSELGANYQLPYTARPMYFKLDLTSLKDNPTSDPLISTTTASYIKLTDADEIADHSKTYGGRSSQVNIQYDDPIVQYMDVSELINFSQKDLTFKNFTPSRSSGNYSILTRNLPDILIINPVSATEDNPYNGYSDINIVSETSLLRRLRIGAKLGLTQEDFSRPALGSKLTYTQENTFRIGLVGINDTQNIYYPFDPDQFPNQLTVTERSPVGHVYYNVIEGIKTKYRYNYITWWDVFRRLRLTELTRFKYNVPASFIAALETGFKGHRIRSVLQREDAVGSNLVLRPGQVEDTIILSEGDRDGPTS